MAGNTPWQRDYVHRSCGGQTRVAGVDLEALLEPFVFCTSTKCAVCGRYDRLANFTWADSGETVAARRQRLRAACPPALKVCGWFIVPLVAAAGGALGGWYLLAREWIGATGGAILLAVLALQHSAFLLGRYVWRINHGALP